MKNRFLFLFVMVVFMPWSLMADTFVNLTPTPTQMTVADGELVLPNNFTVNCAGLDSEVVAEAQKFVDHFNAATGYSAQVSTAAGDALVNLALYAGTTDLGDEGYHLEVTAEGVTVEALAPAGFYYAFQTVKKILPPNVMAKVNDASVTSYALPLVNITDKPRFGYRSFSLDVSRHFFDVAEVKRMIDVATTYKMNRFHWHLTDDQGWRVEIKKWPKLTTVGSIAPNCRITDMETKDFYMTNEPYGPYFYTQDELREVVDYAKERHIEILPEIDMPGHFVAALVAYPEFSCTPNAERSVWVDGGVSSDVLNVANPDAVQFAKDVLAEIIEIFPYEYVHIGGDECPTTAWESNTDCQNLKKELGFSSYRQLQSYFVEEIGNFVKSKGRKIAAWNETITASGADTGVMQDLDALIYCWDGADAAASTASSLGLKAIYTPSPPYYLSQTQRPGDPGYGDGSHNVMLVYSVAPHESAYGVQGSIWTEYISSPEILEYFALPRLIAIAETGWSLQENRDFADFQRRITADSTLLNYNNYEYNRDYMVEVEPGQYDRPNGTMHSNNYTYVEHIYTENADTNIDKRWTGKPDNVYQVVDQTVVAQQGSTFNLRLDAYSLGAYSTSTVRQDLRYDAAIIFVDWDGDGRFEQLSKIGSTPPSHVVGGNMDVLTINQSISVPVTAQLGERCVRVIYCNAWKTNPGEFFSSPSAKAQNISDGVAYDIMVNVTADPSLVPYAVTFGGSENGTFKIQSEGADITSGDEFLYGTVLTVVTTPNEGYRLDAITVNGSAITGNTFTVRGATEVVVTFREDTGVEYATPSGNIHSGRTTYVERIRTTGAEENVDQSWTSAPGSVYQMVDKTVLVQPGATFNLYLDAYKAGEASSTTAYQDLRYTRAYIYTDWNRDGAFTEEQVYGVASPQADANPNNVLANYNTVMEINQSFTVPANASLGESRIRVIYHNAWESLNNGANSTNIKEGMAYDIAVKVYDPSGIEEVAENQALYYFNGSIYTNVEGEIAVYDLSGKLVRRAQSAPVAVDDLADGMYIVKVNGAILKFVK